MVDTILKPDKIGVMKKLAPNTTILYKVRGRWTFPTDMLRYDAAVPASVNDQYLIDNLSGEFCPDGFNLRNKYAVILSMSAGELGRLRPNYERWKSFNWEVIEEVVGGQYFVGGEKSSDAEVIGAYSPETQGEWLRLHGYCLGVRDPRLNTNYPGEYMVTESDFADYELPTKDGSNGPWCIVGDDLDRLVTEAFSVHFDDYWFSQGLQR